MADEIPVDWSEKASILGPAFDAFAVTPSDSVDFITSGTSNPVARSLYIGTAGNVVLKTDRGNIATFFGLTAGFILPIRCRRVNSTSTTASGIVAFY